MVINFLTIQQVEQALDNFVDLVQLFTRDYKFTFFITKEEYAEESVRNSVSAAFLISNTFDSGAYWVFMVHSAQPANTGLVHFIQRMRPGIIVGTLDDFNKCSECPVFTQEKKPNGFAVEHFPKGTLVTASAAISGMGTFRQSLYPSVFHVTKVIQNGTNSFVLKTSTPSTSPIAKEDDTFEFNMDHVDTILMRGAGELIVERFPSYNKDRVDMLNATHEFPELARKNRWLMHGAVDLVKMMVSQLPRREGSVVDYYDLTDRLLDQSFVKHVMVGDTCYGSNVYLFSINKKRAKRFVKQNLNRFLSSAKKAQKKEYDDETRSLEGSWGGNTEWPY